MGNRKNEQSDRTINELAANEPQSAILLDFGQKGCKDYMLKGLFLVSKMVI
jgi:hypothetical protein